MKLTPDIESAYSLCCTTYRQPCNCEKNNVEPCKMLVRKVEELKLEPMRDAMHTIWDGQNMYYPEVMCLAHDFRYQERKGYICIHCGQLEF